MQDGLKNVSSNINSFLMIGQSNMAGRGHFDEVEPIKNKLCHMLRMGRWQAMSEPINPDRVIFNPSWHSGISLGASFADDFAKYTGCPVGMIPCADGGTSIDQWMPGEILYDHAVMMTKLAMRSSNFSGILWHQGESDCAEAKRILYKEKFITMITAMRRDLGNENIPVIIGELGTNVIGYKEDEDPVKMNAVFYEIAKTIPMCAVVSSEGFTLNSDGIHFDSKSLRIFGSRYFEAYRKLVSEN
ncbi:MAG: sialate O-acetylesterase [Ruminococcaceae bacterium]|nr:sialate O-acetylesterase [Oscillospiraceae bacterium]